MKVIQLGCGLVGRTIARDLSAEPKLVLTLVDRDESALRAAAAGLEVDGLLVSDLSVAGATRALVQGQDLVVSAVPGWLGHRVVTESIEAGCAVVDISQMPEDPFSLAEAARAKGLPVIIDGGLAPGLTNLVIGRAAAALDVVDDVLVLVGALPVVRRLPWEHVALSSLVDVIAEHSRPARVIEGGREVARPALSELEHVQIAGLGTLEAFLSDGLHTLLKTTAAGRMRLKLLRYPGHCERLRLLSRTGLFAEEKVRLGEVEVSPRELTGQLLARQWRLEPGEEDLVLLRIHVRGQRQGEPLHFAFDLVDVFDTERQETATARTTGYVATALVKLVTSGVLRQVGVIPPELIGREPPLCERVLAHLAERGVHVVESVEPAAGVAPCSGERTPS